MNLKIGDCIVLVPIKGKELSQSLNVKSILKEKGPNTIFKIISFGQNTFIVEYGNNNYSINTPNWNFIKCNTFNLPEELFVL